MNHKQKTKLARKMMSRYERKQKVSHFGSAAWNTRKIGNVRLLVNEDVIIGAMKKSQKMQNDLLPPEYCPECYSLARKPNLDCKNHNKLYKKAILLKAYEKH